MVSDDQKSPPPEAPPATEGKLPASAEETLNNTEKPVETDRLWAQRGRIGADTADSFSLLGLKTHQPMHNHAVRIPLGAIDQNLSGGQYLF